MIQRTIPRTYPAHLPGVTVEWLAKANNCSPRTIRRWRKSPPPDDRALSDFLINMTPELAQEMAGFRPSRGLLPFWSRLAIADFAARGATYGELMEMFGVGRSTVYRAIHRHTRAFCSLSGRRTLTEAQSSLPTGDR